MFKKFIHFITFVDLPIRNKFILFSLGVLFWFVIMYVVSIAANLTINNKTDTMFKLVIPHDRTTQKIARKLQGLKNDIYETANISDIKTLTQKVDISRARILDIKTFISTLLVGGQINDFDRDTDILLETLLVSPPNGIMATENFANKLNPLLDAIDVKLTEIANLRAEITNGPSISQKTNEYMELISNSHAITLDHSYIIANLYTVNSEKIREITHLTLLAFTGVLLIATTLLIIFTLTISTSFTLLVGSIIEQIKSLGTGKVDLTKKIEVKSKDEIGTLSEEFNTLTKEIHEIITFKKVIEEDDCIEDVYSRLGKTFSDKFGLYEYMIYEVSDSQNKIKPVYPIILETKNIYCNEDIMIDCSLCKVRKTGRTISSIAYPEICKHFRTDLEREHICIPMIIGGKTGGIVQFLFDKDDFNYGSKEKKLFKAEQYIKESLSVIEAKRLTNTLRESALKDSLTGLYNRRFLQEYTETLIAGVLRRENIVGLIMCDLDFFKQVNDHYGHNVGDMVLKETAGVIKKCVRTADLVIRFGGEEFLVLMLDVKEGETFKTAEKIRKAIEETKVKVPDGIIKKTISLGVSEFPSDAETFWQTIKFADVALYKAKETGRNKSVRFTEEMWSENNF